MEHFSYFPKSEAKFQHWPQNSFELRRFCGKVLSSVPIVSICTTILPLHIGTGCITGGKTEEQILNLPPSSTFRTRNSLPTSVSNTGSNKRPLVDGQTFVQPSSYPKLTHLPSHNSGMQADKSGTREPRIHRAHEIKRPLPIIS